MGTQPQQPQAIQKVETSPLILQLAERYGMAPKTMIDTVIATVFPDGKATVPQLMMLLQVAAQYKLNPFTKEIYAFPSKGGGVVPIVPIDGWSNIVNSHPQYDGVDFVDAFNGTQIVSTTCTIHRKDRNHPTTLTEYFDECKRDTEPWKKWPKRMLRHKSFIQAARIAFSLAGIYDPDEAERIVEAEDHREPITRPQPLTVTGQVVEEPVTNGKPAPEVEQKPIPTQAAEPTATVPAATTEPTSDSKQDAVQGVPVAFDTPTAEPPREKLGGPFVPQRGPAGVPKLSKLFAICAAAGIVVKSGSHDDQLHKILMERWQIASVNEIPIAIFGEVCETIGKGIKTR